MPFELLFPPGLLFVAATLLPLASFTLLLVWGALRWALRPYAKDGGPAAAVYDAIGGDVGGRAPAYVATAAMALACALSIGGFVLYLADHHEVEEEIKALKVTKKQDDKGGVRDRTPAERHAALEAIEDVEHEFAARWNDSSPWISVLPRVAPDAGKGTLKNPGNGTMLMLGYHIDTLAAIMFVMVTFVATLIHLFSLGYMADEQQAVVEDHEVHGEHGHLRRRGRFGRFFMYLSLFCFSMLNLLLADNLFQVFVSWELVGVCSYLLIGFYVERHSASSAANKAFITNRVGDAGFLIGLMILWTYVGTFNIEELFQRLRAPEQDHVAPILFHGHIVTADCTAEFAGGHTLTVKSLQDVHGTDVVVFPRDKSGHFHFGTGHDDPKPAVAPFDIDAYEHPRARQYGHLPYWMLVLAGLGIFLGCVGKSAQFPLQVWLPDAMEGPTPVSALIHAATMVAAGVYLVARVYPIFLPEVLLVIAYTGAITLFVAATIAVVMTDIKKVLAYSTVSQLGYMMLALGVGGWTAGAFHLLTHAFFKALLFLGSGSVIYGCHHQQDMLKMGGLYPKMKITAITMLMGVLAICGVPLFAGWYSKDAILVSALSFVADHHREHFLLFALPLATAALTTFYMFRMWFMTFTGKPRDAHVFEHAHESPWLMTVPLIVLGVLSVCVAWGYPPTDPHESLMAHQLEHSQPDSLAKDFRYVANEIKHKKAHIANPADHHTTAGNLALLMVVLGVAFAWTLYYKKLLDPAEAKEQFPGVHRFLMHKWYFDEFYSAVVVRPGLAIAGWANAFDARVIDPAVNTLAQLGVLVSRWSGRADRGIVDGLVNVLADTWYAVGSWLRTWQTGYIRSYVLFLALAAMAIWVLLVTLFGVAIGSQ